MLTFTFVGHFVLKLDDDVLFGAGVAVGFAEGVGVGVGFAEAAGVAVGLVPVPSVSSLYGTPSLEETPLAVI
ncbi:hypothetical protein D3C71_2029950 [compost metagenome]